MWGKPQVPVYPEMGHMPLLIAWPGVTAGACDALTTTVDLHATLCDVFGVTPGHRTHGHSLVPLLDGRARRACTNGHWCGVWGREVHVSDGDPHVRQGACGPRTGRCRCTPTGGRSWPLACLPRRAPPRPDQHAQARPRSPAVMCR